MAEFQQPSPGEAYSLAGIHNELHTVNEHAHGLRMDLGRMPLPRHTTALDIALGIWLGWVLICLSIVLFWLAFSALIISAFIGTAKAIQPAPQPVFPSAPAFPGYRVEDFSGKHPAETAQPPEAQPSGESPKQ